MSCIIHPGHCEPKAILVSLAKSQWHITINNKLVGDGGVPTPYWDLRIMSKDDPTWLSAGVALDLPNWIIESGSARAENGGRYANGSYWGRNIVGYRLPHSNINLIVYFGTLGDINDTDLQPVSLVKFVKNGGIDDQMIKLISFEGKDSDETELNVSGTFQKIRATASPPVSQYDGAFRVSFTIERI